MSQAWAILKCSNQTINLTPTMERWPKPSEIIGTGNAAATSYEWKAYLRRRKVSHQTDDLNPAQETFTLCPSTFRDVNIEAVEH